MRLVSFTKTSKAGYGILRGEGIDVLGWGLGMRGLLATGTAAIAEASVLAHVPLSEVVLAPPVPDAGKIFCVANNFDEPARGGKPLPDYPLIFTRYADTLVGHGVDLRCPAETQAYDFEGELAVVIGKAGHRIARDAAMEHVAGYACFNDGSVRDWQRHSSQFTPGKNFWQSGSFGPWLVTPQALPDLSKLHLVTRVNQIEKQRISLGQMIFDIAWLISYISTFSPLSVGDVIATGTPSGFGSTQRPPVFLSAGDLVEVEIEGIGLLSNRVAAG